MQMNAVDSQINRETNIQIPTENRNTVQWTVHHRQMLQVDTQCRLIWRHIDKEEEEVKKDNLLAKHIQTLLFSYQNWATLKFKLTFPCNLTSIVDNF